MKIAVLGVGNVGSTLGRRFTGAGHEVMYGVRKPDDPKHTGMKVASMRAACADAEVIVLAVPWSAAIETVGAAGDVSGKIIIDATNPFAADFSGLADLDGRSAAELIAARASTARVVKAFNTIGFNVMENPAFGNERASLLIAGDDMDAKKVVADLATEIGFEPVDAGTIQMAHYLEAQAWIWIALALKYGYGRDIAFRLMRR